MGERRGTFGRWRSKQTQGVAEQWPPNMADGTQMLISAMTPATETQILAGTNAIRLLKTVIFSNYGVLNHVDNTLNRH